MDSDDGRPYVKVYLGKEQLWGLLDSGASISCLGQGALEFLERENLKIAPLTASVLTADGTRQPVKGTINLDISFRGETKALTLFVIPSLSQKLYLGVDFWRAFKIAPTVIAEITPNLSPASAMDMHDLTMNQKHQLEQAIAQFPSFTTQGLGKTHLEEHVIDTEGAVPIKQKHYPVSPAIQKLMHTELDRMLELGVIEESNSPWNSPVVLVRKPGKVRLCLDSRKVNQVTKKDAYPLPHIDGLLGRLQNTRVISSIDLKDAFWQIPLEKAAREKTAFTVPGRPLYQFTVMPFGLCNAPQRMCRLMDKAIPGRLRENVFVYLDDLLIASPDFDSHIKTLHDVAACLRHAGLTINVQKSRFCVKEVRYLGFMIGDGSLKTDPDKVAAVANFPTPSSVKQTRRFLGMTGWYQRFIPNYSDLAAPITDCLKKHKTFTWTPEAQQSFEKLKSALTSAPFLITPDFSKHFYLQCDASKAGVGSVLFQIDDDGAERPISYMSKKLNAAQRNYSITELECYAAVLSVKKFRAYIEGHPFTIITDHASLKWLMGCTDLSGRLARWSLKLQGFDFKIEHRKGSQNIVPDTLSRMYAESIEEVREVLIDVDFSSPFFSSEEYEELRSTILNHQEKLPDLCVSNGYVYKRQQPRRGDPIQEDFAWKLWVPSGLTEELIYNAHCPPQTSHGGIHKTLYRLREKYYWPNMVSQVKTFIQNCSTCKETKAPNNILRPPMGKQFETCRPFQFLYIDFLGPYPRTARGNTVIFVALDAQTKYVLLKPMRAERAPLVTSFLEEEIFSVYGVPETIFSDNGKQFTSHLFQKLLADYGVKHVRTAKHSPHPNASERVNRSILAAIRAYIQDKHQAWDLHLPAIGSSLRTSVHQSIGVDPYYALFGYHMVQHGSTYPLLKQLQQLETGDVILLPPEDRLTLIRSRIKENLKTAHLKHERLYNTRCREVTYHPGQEIFCRTFPVSNMKHCYNAKLEKKFRKSRIIRRIGQSLYELEDMSGRPIGVYHAKDLRQ